MLHFNSEVEWTLTEKYKLCVKDDYFASVLQEKLLIKPFH